MREIERKLHDAAVASYFIMLEKTFFFGERKLAYMLKCIDREVTLKSNAKCIGCGKACV